MLCLAVAAPIHVALLVQFSSLDGMSNQSGAGPCICDGPCIRASKVLLALILMF